MRTIYYGGLTELNRNLLFLGDEVGKLVDVEVSRRRTLLTHGKGICEAFDWILKRLVGHKNFKIWTTCFSLFELISSSVSKHEF